MKAPKSDALRKHVIELLKGGHAHADFDAAVSRFPIAKAGDKPRGAEHTAWELLEHLRIAQRDIIEFSRNAKHVSPAWPQGYWPETPAPPKKSDWAKSVRAFRADLKAMQDLVAEPASDLLAPIPHGDGQTLLREALLLADHNSYHLGQFIMLRRLLGIWKS